MRGGTHNIFHYGWTILLTSVFLSLTFLPGASSAEGVTVTTPEELQEEINKQTKEITLGADIETSGTLTIKFDGLKIINEEGNSFTWTHKGTILFTVYSEDQRDNSALDYIENKYKTDFTARYSDEIPITGADSSETVTKLIYEDGTEDSGTAAEAKISGGALIANILGGKNNSLRELKVTGVVTSDGTSQRTYRIGNNKEVLSKVYNITYKTTVTGEEITFYHDQWPSSYTEDDLIQLPGKAEMMNATPDGLLFLGWSTVDGATEYIEQVPIPNDPAGDKEFYANYKEVSIPNGRISGGGRGSYSFSGLSGLTVSSGTTSAASVSDLTEQAAVSQAGSPNNGRRVSAGTAKTEVVFHDDSSESLDLDGVINSNAKQDHTKQFLILGIGLVAAAVIGIAAMLKKKR